LVFICCLLLTVGCVIMPLSEGNPAPLKNLEGYGTLDKFPYHEAWYGMYFHEDKVGYSHFKIMPDGDNFSISSDSVMRLTAMKKTNEIKMSESVVVKPDLSLVSFKSSVSMNGKNMNMIGNLLDKKFVVKTTVEGETLSREFPVENRVYHSSAISLLPALRGLREAGSNTFTIFNAEKQVFESVTQLVSKVKGKAGPAGAVWQVKNNFGQSTVYSWLNAKGLTVLEKTLDGSLITILEDKPSVEKFLQTKTTGKDIVLDLSLIKVSHPIPNSEKIRRMTIKMSGISPKLIPNDHRQKVSMKQYADDDGFDVSVVVEGFGDGNDQSFLQTGYNSDGNSPDYCEDDINPSPYIQSSHKEIVDMANQIAASESSAMKKVNKLVAWTADNISDKMTESFSALSVLRDREGECQAHSLLYAALARASRIPTRLVTGLMYSQGLGFVYHAWAESYVNGWLAVDPTFKQVPADATHIKITTGDFIQKSSDLLPFIGRLRIDVVQYQ
jgi:hypothetical protein